MTRNRSTFEQSHDFSPLSLFLLQVHAKSPFRQPYSQTPLKLNLLLRIFHQIVLKEEYPISLHHRLWVLLSYNVDHDQCMMMRPDRIADDSNWRTFHVFPTTTHYSPLKFDSL